MSTHNLDNTNDVVENATGKRVQLNISLGVGKGLTQFIFIPVEVQLPIQPNAMGWEEERRERYWKPSTIFTVISNGTLES